MKINTINMCLYLYLILKPFYINTSGTLQISDIFILIAFIIVCIITKEKNDDILIKKMQKQYKFFLLFEMFVFFINIIGYFLYRTNDFIISTLHYVFIAIGIYVFMFKITDNKFLNMIFNLSVFNILLQFIIFIFNMGRYYSAGRYMGTFNDPNQFGFFIILMIMIIYTIKNILNKNNKIFIVSFLFGIYLIFESASTGMILALLSFLLIQFLCEFRNIIAHLRKYFKKILLFFIITLIITSAVCITYWVNDDFKTSINTRIYNSIINTSIYNRLLGKFDKIESDNISILKDRHLEQIVNYPYYLIIGAGQGNFVRFTDGMYNGEVHSTLPSILFYYGIIPFMILMYWIYLNLKNLNLKQLSVYIAILIESFTLINQRQLLLWFLIIIANLYKINIENKKEECRKNEKNI